MAKTVGSNFFLLNWRLAVKLDYPFTVLQTPPHVLSAPATEAGKSSSVSRVGLEPTTNALRGHCSTTELPARRSRRLSDETACIYT